jgi:hypothetical protein
VPEENMVASCSVGGILHTFVATSSAVFVTWKGGQGMWNAGGSGFPAGLIRLAAAPQGQQISAISAIDDNGILTVFCRTANAASWVLWRGRDGRWSSGSTFSHFAAAPR